MEVMSLALDGLLLVGLAYAALVDVRTRRIGNRLTLSVTVVGIFINVATAGWDGARQSGLGWLVGVGFLALPFAIGTMGAGDVKLLAAIGAWKGPRFVLVAAIYACVVGGVWAIGYLLRHRPTTSARRRARFPFAPAIAAGASLALLVALAPFPT
jgi:prepilin peptidase CpaA